MQTSRTFIIIGTILILLMFSGSLTKAQEIGIIGMYQEILANETDYQATSPPQQVLISKIGPNNNNDFVELYIPPSSLPLDLTDWQLVDDNNFFTFPETLILESGYIKISKDPENETQFNSNKGLTKTSENLNLIDPDGNIVDALCWHNQSPTSDELADLQELLDNNAWQGECFDSDLIDKNVVVERTSMFDTNSVTDWQIIVDPQASIITPPIAKISVIDGQLSAEAPLSLTISANESTVDSNNEITKISWQLDGSLISSVIEPDSIMITETGLHELRLTITDSSNLSSSHTLTINALPGTTTGSSEEPEEEGNNEPNNQTSLWPYLKIKSALPNPAGPDTGFEQITLIYSGPTPLTISNWQLDDIEGGSKPYTIPDQTLQPNQELTLTNAETKINLNNGGDSIRLFNPNGEIQDQFDYEDSEENQLVGPGVIGSNEIETTPTTTKATTNAPTKQITASSTKTLSSKTNNSPLKLTEVFPNPTGTDTDQEWFEIYNSSNSAITLTDWQLTAGDKNFRIAEATIQPLSYLKINETTPKLTLKNSDAELQLNNSNQADELVQYSKASENQSYSKINNEWQWTPHLTPGAANPQVIEITGQYKIDTNSLTSNILTMINNESSQKIKYSTGQINPELFARIKNAKPDQQLNIQLTALKIGQELELIELTQATIIKTGNSSGFLWLVGLVVLGILGGIGFAFRKHLAKLFNQLKTLATDKKTPRISISNLN